MNRDYRKADEEEAYASVPRPGSLCSIEENVVAGEELRRRLDYTFVQP
jgi:hypothetical protein